MAGTNSMMCPIPLNELTHIDEICHLFMWHGVLLALLAGWLAGCGARPNYSINLELREPRRRVHSISDICTP